MQGNERAKGDPFAPIKYIESFHQAWVADGVARWTSAGYRAQNLFFWPGVALLTLDQEGEAVQGPSSEPTVSATSIPPGQDVGAGRGGDAAAPE